MRFKGYVFIFFAAVFWGLIGPVSRFAFDEGTSAVEVGFFRAVFAWMFFAVHAAYKRKITVNIKDIPLLLFFALTGISLFYAANMTSVKEGGAALAAILLYTAPVWVVMISPLIYKERITKAKLIAVALTLAGLACVCMYGDPGGPSDITISAKAIVAGLIAGLSYSMYYLSGKYFTYRYDSYTLFFYILPIGAAGLLPFFDISQKSVTTWGVLIVLGFICTYLANSCYYLGLKYLEPTRAVLTATLEPVIAALIAFLIWNEYFSLTGFLGAFLILAGVLLTIADKSR